MNHSDSAAAVAELAAPDPAAAEMPASAGSAPASAGPTEAQDDRAPLEAARLEIQLRNGASWFYWIAGLSVVNTAIGLFDGQWGFVVGLGITQLIEALAQAVIVRMPSLGFAANASAIVLNLMIAGFFVLLGWLAAERARWAFPLGMALYALDGGLFVLVGDWWSVGFHVFVLLCLHTGYRALKAMDAAPRPDGAA
ncbi:MAG: hypothetical protein JXQ29_15055 [Planctomycetes bacterium]|nr:hypothetical protein [Planctomycetota bacterium]